MRAKFRSSRVNRARVHAGDPPTGASEVQRMIAEAGVLPGGEGGFAPGRESEDWLKAEAEVLARGTRARNLDLAFRLPPPRYAVAP
jgi:Protein of unknown function (DUF2934)